MHRLNLVLGVLSLAAVLAACSGATAADATPVAPAGSGGSSGNAVVVVAKDIAFTTREISVPAGKPFQLTLDNRDGAPHNVAIYTDSNASTKVSVGEIFGGPGQRTQSVPALAPGTYFFRCDVHQNMTGTIVAS